MAKELVVDKNKILTTSGEIELTPDIIRKYLVSGGGNVTDQEIVMFMGLCKANKLNPFNRDAYLIKYGNQAAALVVNYQVYLKRGISHPQYDGYESGIVVLNKDGNIEKRDGHIWIKNTEKLLGAWCKVYRKDWEHPVYQEVNFDEYAAKTKEGKLNSNWENKPTVMITKVAISTAFRNTFVEELRGMYIAEEVESTKTTYSKEIEDIVPIEDILGDEE